MATPGRSWIYLIYIFNCLTLLSEALSANPHLVQTEGSLVSKRQDSPDFRAPDSPEGRAFICEYPDLPDYEFCSTEDDRGCWLKPKDPNSGLPTYNIETDYENVFPKGITRKYVLDVDRGTVYPDGCENSEAKLFNATYPGPWIEACWGDDIEVTVRNHLPCNGTTIHWHGLRMFENVEYDGVNAMTQCPIAPGDSYTYKFHARQHGTSWYHSHYSLQYGDGLAGPLTIHGPSSGNYDTSIDPILMTDWNHRSAFQDWAWSLDPGSGFRRPRMTSILLNGKGVAPEGVNTCVNPQPTAERHSITFEKGVRYLLRLINTSVDTAFVFSIDGHELEVIEADFVPIEPYTARNVLVGIGQRYHVVVTASPIESAPDDNYWIRTVPAAGCGSFRIPYSVENATTGIVRYDAGSNTLPTSSHSINSTECSDEPYDLLRPRLRWNVPEAKRFDDTDVSLVQVGETDPHWPKHANISRWQLYKGPLWLDFSDPTILNPEGSNQTFHAQLKIDTTPSPEEQWMEILITGPQIGAAHPIHLHGHDFALLSQGIGPFDESTAIIKRDNPPRRDVALLPGNGYLLIAFKIDNPGVWLMHCHIAWHASSGLAMQILENANDIMFHDKPALEQTCNNWQTWFDGERLNTEECLAWNQTHFQDDSGI